MGGTSRANAAGGNEADGGTKNSTNEESTNTKTKFFAFISTVLFLTACLMWGVFIIMFSNDGHCEIVDRIQKCPFEFQFKQRTKNIIKSQFATITAICTSIFAVGSVGLMFYLAFVKKRQGE